MNLVMKVIKMMVLENVLVRIQLVQQDIKMMVEILKIVLHLMQIVLLDLKMMEEAMYVFLVKTLVIVDIKMMVDLF